MKSSAHQGSGERGAGRRRDTGDRRPVRPPRFLTVRDVMAELQFSRAKAYRVMHQMLHLKDGGSLRVSRAAFEIHVRQRERQQWRGNTSAGESGGGGTTRAPVVRGADPPDAPTPRPPTLSLLRGSGLPPIRPTQPRTKPR